MAMFSNFDHTGRERIIYFFMISLLSTFLWIKAKNPAEVTLETDSIMAGIPMCAPIPQVQKNIFSGLISLFDSEKNLVVPNDNTKSGGSTENGVFKIDLEARQASWRPDNDYDQPIPALAFAELGMSPQIPGPFLRVRQGTHVMITIRNSIPDTAYLGLPTPRFQRENTSSTAGNNLFVHGLRAGTSENDTLIIPYGRTRVLEYQANKPGTFLYWAAMSPIDIDARTGTDAQLTGLIVVDPLDTRVDPDERFFVITHGDIFPDTAHDRDRQDFHDPAINGLSWPYTERLVYSIHTQVKWRWINGSHSPHPMHLHGFHFRTTARGDGRGEVLYPSDEIQHSVTELIQPGGSMRMEWIPTREGNWMMHCHIRDHVIPMYPRDPALQEHDLEDVSLHALHAMDGLVMGITITDSVVHQPARPEPDQVLRLVADEIPVEDSDLKVQGFTITESNMDPVAKLSVPGPILFMRKDKTTAINVVNRLSDATTIHWHGMEIDSYYDGIAGWSRTGTKVAPLIAPNDSFLVYMTPPRAGTYIYHTHMDETEQIMAGMYGPLIVLDTEEVYDTSRNRIIVFGNAIEDQEYRFLTINGSSKPASLSGKVGIDYRLRFINITEGSTLYVSLEQDGRSGTWLPWANDGADLPAALQTDKEAKFAISAGETYDFIWIPQKSGEASIVIFFPYATIPGDETAELSFTIS